MPKLIISNILLFAESNIGVMLHTVDDVYSNQLEYLLTAPNLDAANKLEADLFFLLNIPLTNNF